jgi:hypothetical protein
MYATTQNKMLLPVIRKPQEARKELARNRKWNRTKEEIAEYFFTDPYRTETRLREEKVQEKEEKEKYKCSFHELIWLQKILTY